MKKKYVISLLLTVNLGYSYAQTPIIYEYDESGNRIHRQVGQFVDKTDETTSTSQITQMVGKYKFILGPSPTTGLIQGYVEDYDGEGIIVAVNTSNGNSCSQHFSNGKFLLNLTNFPDGIYVMQLIIINNGQTIQNNNVKIVKKG